jgi:mannose-1-phosphate guanylyltransferase
VVEAVILAGGRGTRLQPLTLRTPKPMLPLAGVPFLTHQLARLSAAGVEHVVLATSYLPEVFQERYGDGAGLHLRLDYVTEAEPLGTGGGIRNVAGRLESGPQDPVLILNGDVLSGHDLTAQLELHQRRGAAVTLHLVEVDDPRAYGCVPTGSDGRVTDFVEESPSPPTNRINAGCYVFARHIIDRIPAGRPVSVEREVFPGLLADGQLLVGDVDSSYWLDVGTPATFVQGSADIVRGIAGSAALQSAPGESLVGAGSVVDPTARVSGGSAVAGGSTVAEDAQVHGSVIGRGVEIGAGSSLQRCLVGDGVRIGPRCHLTDVVVGDGARIGCDNELAAGARVWTDAVIPDAAIRFSPLA